MPIKVPFQYLDGVGEPARSQLWRDFEEIQRFLDSLDLSAGSGRVGTTPTSLLRVGNTYVGSHPVHGVNQAPASNWAALGHWDKQGSADYAFMQNGDGRTLVNASAGQTVGLRIAGSAVATVNADNMDIMEARVGRAGYGNQYAAFGFGAAGVAQGTYGFMQSNVGYTFVNCANGQDVAIRMNNSSVAVFRGHTSGSLDGLELAYGWFRPRSTRGIYWQDYGGGWFMQDTTYIRAYGDKEIYTNNKVRGMETGMRNGTWGGGHAVVGYHSLNTDNHCGLLQRWDGMVWLRSPNNITFHLNGAEPFTISNSGGWADMRANLATLGGTVMVIAGSNQFGRQSSSKRYKTVVGPLDKATDLGLGQPVSEHPNPVWKMRPLRYLWNEQVGNWKDINPLFPDGIAGFIAEEVMAVAPDAVIYDEPGVPANLDQNAMLAYIVGGLQHVHAGGHRRNDRLNALEALVSRIAQFPALAAFLKK